MLAALPVLWTAFIPSPDPPVTFCRSGTDVVAAIASDNGGEVQLRAFGRSWSPPVAVVQGAVRFTIPDVRVPVAFQIVSTKPPLRIVGEIVAYSRKGETSWPAETSIYVDRSAPRWVTEWLTAVGLPFRAVNIKGDPASRSRNQPRRGVLIIGRSTERLRIPATRAWESANLLVIGDRSTRIRGLFQTEPHNTGGSLGLFRKQSWPRPLRFTFAYVAWNGVLNRHQWLRSRSVVGVEEVFPAQSNRRIVLNYLPWQQQLGRNEIADVVFQQLLKAAAQPEKEPSFDRRVRFVWPERSQIQAGERPVLAAACRCRAKSDGPQHALWILDLRGRNLSASECAILPVPGRKLKVRQLLVLGTDPHVANGRWSETRIRQNRNGKHGGVVWLTDDALPPSARQRMVLMQTLSDLHVKLRGANLK